MTAKPYASKEEEEEARIGGARRLLEQWGNRCSGDFSGSIRVQHQKIDGDRTEVSPIQTLHVGPPEPASMTRLPRNMSLHDVSEMFAERDRMKAKAADEDAIIDPATVTAAAISNAQTGLRTPIRVLRFRMLRWLYNAITKELP